MEVWGLIKLQWRGAVNASCEVGLTEQPGSRAEPNILKQEAATELK